VFWYFNEVVEAFFPDVRDQIILVSVIGRGRGIEMRFEFLLD
jgi:hypothetical protein